MPSRVHCLAVLTLAVRGKRPRRATCCRSTQTCQRRHRGRAASHGSAASVEDGRDAEFAARGFIATRANPVIKAADGHTVWNLAAYDFVAGPAPATVNPSLWRHTGCCAGMGCSRWPRACGKCAGSTYRT